MSTSEQMRKVATGVCLILAPLALLVGVVLHPAESTDAAEQLAIIAADAERWAVAHYILSGGAVLLAGAVIGLAHLLHERRPGQAIIGGAMGVVGAMGLCAVAFSEATFGAALGRHADGSVAAYGEVAASAAFVVILLAALLGPLGAIVLGHGLWKSNVAPTWAAMALMLGGACLTIGLPTALSPLVIAGAALHVLAMAPIGVRVLSESDEDWIHTPARALA